MKNFLLPLIFIVHCFTLAAQNKSLLLQNATIIDGDASVRPRKGSLLLKNGCIEKLIWNNEDKSVKADTVIDCSGKFICPGLIDAHVHLTEVEHWDIVKEQPSIDNAVSNMIRHGITTVRDMAGNAPLLQWYNNAAENGSKKCPAIFYAAQFGGPEYFQMANWDPGMKQGTYPWSRSVTDTTNIARIVTEAKNVGVTGIKIYAYLSPKLVAAITKEAHAQGLQAWSHVAVHPARPLSAIAASVNSMSHVHDFAFEQFSPTESDNTVWQTLANGLKADSSLLYPVLQEMKNKNVILDATVFITVNENKADFAISIAKWAHQIGVKIDAGTDVIYPTTNSMVPLFDEMQVLVSRCGMTISEAIQSATLYGAQAIGVSDRGVIREGKRADLLILNKDPMQDLSALFAPQMVFQKAILTHLATPPHSAKVL